MKSRQQKSYSAEQQAYFRSQQWVDMRSLSAPEECHLGEHCWVKHGPPAYARISNHGACLGCGGQPTLRRHLGAII